MEEQNKSAQYDIQVNNLKNQLSKKNNQLNELKQSLKDIKQDQENYLKFSRSFAESRSQCLNKSSTSNFSVGLFSPKPATTKIKPKFSIIKNNETHQHAQQQIILLRKKYQL